LFLSDRYPGTFGSPLKLLKLAQQKSTRTCQNTSLKSCPSFTSNPTLGIQRGERVAFSLCLACVGWPICVCVSLINWKKDPSQRKGSSFSPTLCSQISSHKFADHRLFPVSPQPSSSFSVVSFYSLFLFLSRRLPLDNRSHCPIAAYTLKKKIKKIIQDACHQRYLQRRCLRHPQRGCFPLHRESFLVASIPSILLRIPSRAAPLRIPRSEAVSAAAAQQISRP
jgi:hypothetical protein